MSAANTKGGGYGKPPVSTRFKKGQSGNPKGRPRGRKKQLPYETVLGQLVTIRDGGVERKVTAAEAFLLYMAKQGLQGDSVAGRRAMVAIEEARMARGASGRDDGMEFIIEFVAPGSVNLGLTALRMAVKHDKFRETARMKLEPWLVQQALKRFGDRRLTPEEQDKVVAATRTPKKIKWPDWWEVLP